jgi:hypothetical protein
MDVVIPICLNLYYPRVQEFESMRRHIPFWDTSRALYTASISDGEIPRSMACIVCVCVCVH